MKRILLPVDEGSLAQAVSEHVEPLFRCKGAEGTYLHVDLPEADEAERAEHQATLERLTEELRAAGHSASAEWLDGDDAAVGILTRARDLDAWLVVMASRGQDDRVVGRGSVTARVLRHATAPLLLFNPDALQTRFRRIVVPLDGSELARRILPRAEELAQVYGADLVLLRVLDPDADEASWERAREELAASQSELELAGLVARTRVVPGWDVAEAILAAVAEQEADLIAMTTHGRSPLAPWPFGSVAEKVFVQAEVPLLIKRVVELRDPEQEPSERRYFPAPAASALPALTGASFPERILVPLDGSDLARRALLLLHSLLRGREAQVTLLSVGAGARRERLEAVARGLSWRGLEVECREVEGDPASEILRAASAAELTIMATHGRSGVGRWLRGSVAERVLRRAPTPLLLANPAGLAELSQSPRAREGELLREILVPLDGSERARAVLPLVAALAQHHHSDVVLLRALELRPDRSRAAENEARAEAEAELAPDLATLRGLGVSARGEVRPGRAAQEVLAATGSADLVAVATHGRSGPKRWLLGSVAESVLRRCARPLLVVRA
ncbi:MAG TPA: hypothetical protein DEA08_33700 [Planctomycetes bacterium]|nr:hypothetical protein [Planctomycetota bacterium]